jgi:hypothetical protein
LTIWDSMWFGYSMPRYDSVFPLARGSINLCVQRENTCSAVVGLEPQKMHLVTGGVTNERRVQEIR